MGYSTTPAGVGALKGLSSRLEEGVQSIQQSVSLLESELASNRSGLGPHADSIQGVIDAMNQEVQGASSPVNELAEKVRALAASYQEFIDTNRF